MHICIYLCICIYIYIYIHRIMYTYNHAHIIKSITDLYRSMQFNPPWSTRRGAANSWGIASSSRCCRSSCGGAWWHGQPFRNSAVHGKSCAIYGTFIRIEWKLMRIDWKNHEIIKGLSAGEHGKKQIRRAKKTLPANGSQDVLSWPTLAPSPMTNH